MLLIRHENTVHANDKNIPNSKRSGIILISTLERAVNNILNSSVIILLEIKSNIFEGTHSFHQS